MSDTKMIVTCKGIDKRFEEYAVATTDKEIRTQLNNLVKNEENKQLMNKIYNCNVKFSEEDLQNHYKAKDQIWQDWCGDVVLYHVFNYVLNNVKIPVNFI